MERIYSWVGKIVLLALVIAGGAYVYFRYIVKPPPTPPKFGYYEIDGKLTDEIVLIFRSSSSGALTQPIPANWVPTDWDSNIGHNFAYVDPANLRWHVPQGEVTDGATVPKILWSFCPGGYNGKFLAAAVVHDRFCRVDEDRLKLGVDWPQVHQMFYYAMRASDVPDSTARVMYAAVKTFGPPKSFDRVFRVLALIFPDRANSSILAATGQSDVVVPASEKLKSIVASKSASISNQERQLSELNTKLIAGTQELEQLQTEVSNLSSILSLPTGMQVESDRFDELLQHVTAVKSSVDMHTQEAKSAKENLEIQQTELVASQAKLNEVLRTEAEVKKFLGDVASNESMSLDEIEKKSEDFRRTHSIDDL